MKIGLQDEEKCTDHVAGRLVGLHEVFGVGQAFDELVQHGPGGNVAIVVDFRHTLSKQVKFLRLFRIVAEGRRTVGFQVERIYFVLVSDVRSSCLICEIAAG